MRRSTWFWMLLFLFGSSTAWAAEEPDAEVAAEEEEAASYPPVRFGVGVSLSSRPFVLLGDEGTAGSPAGMTNVHFPFYLGETFRLEPEFGLLVQNGGFFLGTGPLLVPTEEVADLRTTTFRFLLGLQWATKLSRDTFAYVGPKIGLQTRSMSLRSSLAARAGELKVRAVDFWLGATGGGEAFLTRHFSLGVEVGFYYLNQGSPSILGVDPEAEDDLDSPWFLSTQGMLAARIYFL